MIVLIGGSGFIGREISNKLISIGLKFIILDKKILNDLSKFSKLVDINNLDSLEKNIPEKSIIINLAAVHHDNEKKEDYIVYAGRISDEKGNDREIKNKISFFIQVNPSTPPSPPGSSLRDPSRHPMPLA